MQLQSVHNFPNACHLAEACASIQALHDIGLSQACMLTF